jgi:hypothetical protein
MVWWHNATIFIFIIFKNHSHSTIIDSFIPHYSPMPVSMYPHRFFAKQEKNLLPPLWCRAEIELGQADALPTELRHTLLSLPHPN